MTKKVVDVMLAALKAANTRTVTVNLRNDDTMDRAAAAFREEADRWCWRYNDLKTRPGYELVRNSSPNNNINADEYFVITTLTKRECSDRDDAEAWLNTYRDRAAMRAALNAL